VPTNPNGIPGAITIAASQAQGVESAARLLVLLAKLKVPSRALLQQSKAL